MNRLGQIRAINAKDDDLLPKANAEDVDSALALKADSTSLLLKADITYVNTQIANSRIYDIGCFGRGKPEASSAIIRLVSPRSFSIPVNLTGSVARSGILATATAVFTIKKNTTTVGSITFSSGTNTGSFSSSSIISIVMGDLLEVTAPSTQDATLSDVSFTLVTLLT